MHHRRDYLVIADDPAPVPRARRVLDQDRATWPEAAPLAIASLRLDLPGQKEEELAARRRVPVTVPANRK